MLGKTIFVIGASLLAASCTGDNNAFDASSIIGKTWYCEDSSEQSIDTISITGEGKWWRKHDQRDTAGFGVVHEESGDYMLDGNMLNVKIVSNTKPKANKGISVTISKPYPKERVYEIQEVGVASMVIAQIDNDGARYAQTCGLESINKQIPGTVLTKGSDICGSHKSMMKVIVTKRVNNPYIQYPNDCVVAERHIPVEDVNSMGELVKFRLDGYYYWTSDNSITRN